MNDFFDLDAPLFRFLTRVADMVILSLLWLIGSLPLFTLGISSTALYYAVNKNLLIGPPNGHIKLRQNRCFAP